MRGRKAKGWPKPEAIKLFEFNYLWTPKGGMGLRHFARHEISRVILASWLQRDKPIWGAEY
jgi:hypothetical protein